MSIKMRTLNRSAVLLVLLGLVCTGVLQAYAQEDGAASNGGSSESAEANADDRTFHTKAHFSHKPYYVLRTQQNGGRGGGRHNKATPQGIWYPTFPVGGGHNGGTGQNMQLPQRLQQIGLYQMTELINRAGLHDQLKSGERHYTVFAPTEEAVGRFMKSQPDEVVANLMENRALARGLVFNHIVPGTIASSDMVGGMRIKNLAGNDLAVLATRDGMTVGGARLLDREGRADFKAGNGMVHMIDDVIYPFSAIDAGDAEGSDKTKGKSLRGIDDDDPKLIREIEGGTIRGINLNTRHRAWLGIPYAKPPLGQLRFAKPEKIAKWDDTLETREQPNACQQTPDTTFGDFAGSAVWNPNTDISEDCLYLNVHAPRNATEKLPVLVWIYGGGYTTGSATLDVYDPEAYVNRGVVYVAMQYRLGSHGFLYLGADSGAPGNMGMLDQVMALEWVRDNIAEFGGDPDDVTIMGESAGGNSVALHLVSPKSCGLFQKAILQSAGLEARWAYFDQEKAQRVSEALAKEVGCGDEGSPEDTVECLRDLDSSALLEKEYFTQEYSVNLYPFVPTVDGDFLQADPTAYAEKGAFNPEVPVLLGSNANEGFWPLMYFLTDVMPNKELSEEEKNLAFDDYQNRVGSVFTFYPESIRKLIAYEYRDRASHFNALDQMVGDSDFACSAESFAQTLSKNGNNVYRYFYNHRSSQDVWPKYSGVKHGDEIEFTFGRPLTNPDNYNADEISFAHDVVTYWTNFAKTGNPNPSSLLTSWPKYESPEWKYLNFTAGVGMTSVGGKRLADGCMFWTDVLPDFLQLQSGSQPIYGEGQEPDFDTCGAQK